MTLLEKLKLMNKPDIAGYTDGYSESIKEFWDSFVEPRLPSTDIVIKWYELLLRYVDDDNAVYAIRTYGSWKDNSKDNRDLRRGFYNKTNFDYSFFYTDNFYAAYFEKMAIDGYVPDYEEFKNAMIARQFPARFGRHDTKYEAVKAAYRIDGKNGKDPGFTRHGYKIAHIVNSGTDYFISGQNYTIGQICEKYCPRGLYDDWKKTVDEYGELYVRDLVVDDELKEILKSHFLRFACPMNYILTPGKKYHSTKKKVFNNDIAESIELQQYAMYKFKERYGNIYDAYLSRLMLDQTTIIEDTGDCFIGITYSFNKMKAVEKKVPKKNANRKITPQDTLQAVKTVKKISISDLEKANCLYGYLVLGYSFRKLEKEYLGIESQANGGGYVAQRIIRDFNISATMKGSYLPDELLQYSGSDVLLKRISEFVIKNIKM